SRVGCGSPAPGGRPAHSTRAPRGPPWRPGPPRSSPRGGSRRGPRRRRSGWLASRSPTSSLSRRPERRNDLAAERLGAPASHAVHADEVADVARAREGDRRDQPVRQEQSGLEAEARRRLAAPLLEPLEATLQGGQRRAFFFHPGEPSTALELGHEPDLELEQVGDVGRGILELRRRERTRRPIVLLPRGWEPRAEVPLEEDVEAERGSAQEARRHRGIEERDEPEVVAALEMC